MFQLALFGELQVLGHRSLIGLWSITDALFVEIRRTLLENVVPAKMACAFSLLLAHPKFAPAFSKVKFFALVIVKQALLVDGSDGELHR